MKPDLEERLRLALQPDLEIVRSLGRGSHAVVFLAREPALKRLVAIKVLRPEFNDDGVMRQRFEREAQSAASLHHPNVTPVHRVGRIDGEIPYIVMEYIDSRTLEDTIESSGPLPVDRARPVLAGLASALAAAHARGIVHRDVRPGNVFLEKDTGRAVLADFGIAGLLETGGEAVSRLTGAGVRLGETRYMSPEQLMGESALESSDIYSFGILAYEVLTGRGPYDATKVQDMVVAHLKSEPRPLAQLVPGIDPEFAQLIERCLTKDANRRPTAADLAEKLKATRRSADASAASSTTGPTTFLGELKRRRVFQVAGGYIVIGYGAVMAAKEFLPLLGAGEWVATVAAILYVAGIPIALVLSWIYDITATGIQRTSGEAGSRAAGPGRVAWLALAGAIVFAGLLGWFLLHSL